MNHDISIQLQFFMISILWGGIILFTYDILRILRRLIKHNSIILAIQDIIFWVIASVFIFAMIYKENDGIIRGFAVMGVTIGMVLYHYIFSSFFVNTITKLIQLLLSPFVFVINTIKRFFRFVLLKGKQATNFTIRRLKKQTESFKMNVDIKRQASATKRHKKLEQRALVKQKQRELILAKRQIEKAKEQKLKEQKLNEQKVKEQKAKEQKAKEQKEKEQKAKEQKVQEQKAKEQKVKEQKVKEQKAIEQKAIDQKAIDQKAIEQKAIDQKAIDQKAIDQKDRERKEKQLKKK